MRRVVYTETGDPQVLHLVEEPVAEPGPGEVRVRIVQSGVNPTNWKSRRGAQPGQPVDPAQTPAAITDGAARGGAGGAAAAALPARRGGLGARRRGGGSGGQGS